MTGASCCEPTSARAGDTLTWTRSFADYPASAGWALAYVFVGADKRTISAVADGDAFDVSFTTSGWTAGDYAWQAYVTLAGERHTVATGRLALAPDLTAVQAGFDARSSAKRMLDAVTAVLEQRATSAQAEVQFNGRALKYLPVGDLLVLRDRCRAEVRAEENAARIAAGCGGYARILTRFG